MHVESEYNNINEIILQLVEITLPVLFLCSQHRAITTTSGGLACALHYGTFRHCKNSCVSRTNSENSAFSVNVAQTEEFIASTDYSYHQH